jgi:ABC-type multidrug transport system ATPase subunit
MGVSGAALEAIELRYRYRRGTGVEQVSFAFAPGTCVALYGTAGAGKTTLLRLMAGRLTPEAGVVRVEGRSPRTVRARCGYVAQGETVTSLLTVHQVLSRALARSDVSAAQRSARIAEMLTRFDLYEAREHSARELSHTAQSALALAVVLIQNPAILLLDETLDRLPLPLQKSVADALRERCTDTGLTVLFVTAHSALAEAADRVLLMANGHLLANDTPASLLAAYAADTVTVETSAPSASARALTDLLEVTVTETPEGLRFTTPNGSAAVSRLLRHAPMGVRVLYLRRPTLHDVLTALRSSS